MWEVFCVTILFDFQSTSNISFGSENDILVIHILEIFTQKALQSVP